MWGIFSLRGLTVAAEVKSEFYVEEFEDSLQEFFQFSISNLSP